MRDLVSGATAVAAADPNGGTPPLTPAQPPTERPGAPPEFLRGYRLLTAAFAVIYPLFGVIHHYTSPNSHDPMGLRLLVAGVVATIFIASYRVRHLARNYYQYTVGCGYVVGAHFLYLLYANSFAADYVLGHFVILAVISLTILELPNLIVYLTTMMTGTILIAIARPDRSTHLAVVLGATLSFGLIACISLWLRLRINGRLRASNARLVAEIAERERIQVDLRAAMHAAEEASQAKSQLLANMSHELRTPLNSVIGFAGVLSKNRTGARSDVESVYLARIEHNGRHLLGLIDELLDLSRIEAKSMRVDLAPVHIDQLVRDAIGDLGVHPGERQVPVQVSLPATVRPIMADQRRLTQVFLNLVGNARKFTVAGSITVLLEIDDDGTPRCLEVTDTGCGIPASKLEEVFEPFRQVDSSHRRKHGGAGLGLSISRSLCRLMGFRLEAESVEGVGSTFRVVF